MSPSEANRLWVGVDGVTVSTLQWGRMANGVKSDGDPPSGTLVIGRTREVTPD